jgi:hypothetical protein
MPMPYFIDMRSDLEIKKYERQVEDNLAPPELRKVHPVSPSKPAVLR